jgi:hypothetical protein
VKTPAELLKCCDRNGNANSNDNGNVNGNGNGGDNGSGGGGGSGDCVLLYTAEKWKNVARSLGVWESQAVGIFRDVDLCSLYAASLCRLFPVCGNRKR